MLSSTSASLSELQLHIERDAAPKVVNASGNMNVHPCIIVVHDIQARTYEPNDEKTLMKNALFIEGWSNPSVKQGHVTSSLALAITKKIIVVKSSREMPETIPTFHLLLTQMGNSVESLLSVRRQQQYCILELQINESPTRAIQQKTLLPIDW